VTTILLLRGSRSPRDYKVRQLCLTPTALECTGSGSGNKALLLRLEDVIGAKVTPATVPPKNGGGAAGCNQDAFDHRLEVFAYVPGDKDKETGCAAGGG